MMVMIPITSRAAWTSGSGFAFDDWIVAVASVRYRPSVRRWWRLDIYPAIDMVWSAQVALPAQARLSQHFDIELCPWAINFR